MGSITSRKEWPPKPRKRYIARNYKEVDDNNTYTGGWVKTVEDYTIDWPGTACRSSSAHIADDEQLGGWSNIIRNMEDG